MHHWIDTWIYLLRMDIPIRLKILLKIFASSLSLSDLSLIRLALSSESIFGVKTTGEKLKNSNFEG